MAQKLRWSIDSVSIAINRYILVATVVKVGILLSCTITLPPTLLSQLYSTYRKLWSVDGICDNRI